MEPTSGWLRRLRTPLSRTVRFNDPEFDRLFTVRSGDLNIVRMHLDATRRRTIIAASDNERPDWTVVDGWVVRSSAALARDASLIVENTRFVVHIAMAIAGR